MQLDQLKRRDFITLFGGAAIMWPLEARTQQAGKLPSIGFLGAASSDALYYRSALPAFVRRLGELGLVEGRTVTIERRFADGSIDRAMEIAAEFVRQKVDIIVSHGDAQVLAAKRATAVIPIVFAATADPVGGGLVASLARPGGNVTGLSLTLTDTAGKRLELLRELIPNLRRLAIIGNVANSGVALELAAVQSAAHTLGLETITSEIRRAENIAPAIDQISGRAEALYVCLDPLVISSAARLNGLALVARLPVVWSLRDFCEGGGLISYGPDYPDMYRRSAELVDKILRGAKPADIPVEQPTKFTLVVNLNTAKALGLTISESFLLRADEIIE
jgi:putative tryptophan/tyrosine transport system substrate-binding protein